MKSRLLMFILSLVVQMGYAQTYQATYLELDSEIPKDKDYICEASSSIKLLGGLKCNPDADKSVKFTINRFGVFPPAEGIVGGPPSSDQGGVVGALPAELNVNDIGAAVYSVPIMMPRGIGGMTPDIAVTYNNQSGNGLLGWGWNLSGLSSIVRTGKTKYHDGAITPVDFVNDRFLLDGKRLMLCAGNYGGNGAVYKTEIDEMSKIISYKEGYSGPARFVVYKKDGTVWEYGGTTDSRIETQRNSQIVMTWLVNKITDGDGNYIRFTYDESQNTGEFYINRIDYTLNDNAGIQSMFGVEFNYISRDDPEQFYVGSNIVQIKKLLKEIVIKNMVSGSVMYNYSFDYIEPGNYSNDLRFMYTRLKSIGLSADGMKINDTKIAWNNKAHYPDKFVSYSLDKNTFNKVPFVGDFNSDGYSDVLTVPYKLGNVYTNDVTASIYLNNGDGSFDNNPYYSLVFDKMLEWVYVVDFDGDGKDDIIAYYYDKDGKNWKSRVSALLNRGNSFVNAGAYSSEMPFTIYPGDFCGEKKVAFFVDYCNEGYSSFHYPQIIYCKDNALKHQMLGHEAYSNVPERVLVEDINGDGCSEIIYLLNNCAMINKLSYGNGLYSFVTMSWDYNIDSDDFLFPGDFNGDGNTDFLRYDERTYWKIIYSDGKNFKNPISCLNNNLLKGLTLSPLDRYFCSLENLSRPSVTIRTADFDGDGKTDVAVFKNTGGNYYAEMGFKVDKSPNNTCDFGDIRRYYFGINYSHQYIHIGNFLGQENMSILGSVRANPYTAEIPKIVSLNPHPAKFSVERITDGFGNTHGFRYDYLMPNKNNAFYSNDNKSYDNGIRSVSIPVRALSADTVFLQNNTPCIKKYSYSNILYHANGHGLLGFELSEVTSQIGNNVYERNIIEKDSGIIGENCLLLINQMSKYNNSGLVQYEQLFYDKYQCHQNEKVVMPLAVAKKCIYYDNSNTITKTNVENIEYQSDLSGNFYDNVVNIKKCISGFDENYCGDDALSCNFKKIVDYEYNDDISSWTISRPTTIKHSMCYGDQEAVGYCEIRNYQGNNQHQLTQKIMLPNLSMNYADPLKIVSDYSYDVVGNVTMYSQTSPSSKGQRMKRFEYGGEFNYRLPTMTVNENGWETAVTYGNDYGTDITTVDYNGFAMEYDSDPFEITVEKMLPDGMKNVLAKRWANDNKHSPHDAVYYYWDKTSGKGEALTFYDKNDNKLREVTLNLNGEAVYVDMEYDSRGNMVSKSMPYIVGDDKKNYYYVYDNNDRIVEEVFPNGLVKNYSYNKLQTTIVTTSPNGSARTVIETVNPMGWRTQTVDIGGNTINYEYFSDGKLKSAVIGDNNNTKVDYEYDNLRNLTKMKDPACGEVSYVYNAYGELVESRTPRNCVTTYSYDNLGNIINRVESDEKGNNMVSTHWLYDNKKGKIGSLSSVVCGDNHRVVYDYDDLLRVTRVTETINGIDYSTSYSYDNANRETIVTYPSGIAIQKNYSNSGLYKSITNLENDKTLWKSEKTNAMGYVIDYQVGNGLRTLRTYDENSNVLSGINTTFNGKTYQKLSYSYDGFGNLVNRSNDNGSGKIENFKYDHFNRLIEIKTNGDVTGNVSYDNYGNILSKSNNCQDVFYNAQYDGDNPYAVTKVTIDDEDLYGINQTISYTTFDKISCINYGNNSLSIDYGCDHNRIHSVQSVDGNRKEKTYVGDCEYVICGNESFCYTYLKGPMGVFAICKTDEKGCNSIYYVHKDHLESWCMITDANGDVVQSVSFDAWGNPRHSYSWSSPYNDDLFCDKGFAGHEHLSDFGVINMNGRAYDPMLSMMVSPDSYIQNLDFSQNFNRYSYCYNNPLSYTDPSGEWVEWLLYGVYCGTVNVISNLDYIDNFEEGVLAFGAGFVGGCLTQGLSGCSWALQVFGDVSGAVLETGASKFVKKNTDDDLDWSIFEDKDFKEDVVYSLGSSLVKSALGSYIKQPSSTEQGKTLSGILCGDNKASQVLLETMAGKVAGNIFAGKPMMNGVSINISDLGRLIPYVNSAVQFVSNGFEFECRSEALGNLFDKLLNFDSQAVISDFGYDMNCCYSQIRSLFLKL